MNEEGFTTKWPLAHHASESDDEEPTPRPIRKLVRVPRRPYSLILKLTDRQLRQLEALADARDITSRKLVQQQLVVWILDHKHELEDKNDE